MIAVVKPLSRNSVRLRLQPRYLFFLADSSPLPLGGAITLSCVEPLDSHRSDLPEPPQLSARRSIARPRKASSTFPKKVSGALRAPLSGYRRGYLTLGSKTSVPAFADLKDGAL